MEAVHLDEKSLRTHLFFLGTSGNGRSGILDMIAAERGISVDQLQVVYVEPTEEEKNAAREQEELAEQKSLARMKAVRKAYWNGSEQSTYGPYKDDLHHLYEKLQQFCGIDEPTMEQQEVLFLMLPDDIFGSGIAYGFSDSEVRDNIYEFVQDNAEQIKEAIANAGSGSAT